MTVEMFVVISVQVGPQARTVRLTMSVPSTETPHDVYNMTVARLGAPWSTGTVLFYSAQVNTPVGGGR